MAAVLDLVSIAGKILSTIWNANTRISRARLVFKVPARLRCFLRSCSQSAIVVSTVPASSGRLLVKYARHVNDASMVVNKNKANMTKL